MKLIRLMVVLIIAAIPHHVSAETFRFVYEEHEQYRVLSIVEQDVWVNGVYSHHATILNRIAIEVTSVDGDRGFHEATFITSEESAGFEEGFRWGEEYVSEFWRDEYGYFEIDPLFFMPVVRDVPVFPERDILPGGGWNADGSETHDFRLSFGIPDAYHFPIPVTYRYEGNVEIDGREFAVIDIAYNVFYRPDQLYNVELYPVRISGFSNQRLHWDIRAGRPHSYEETYAFVFTMSTGDEVMYEGTAEARIVEASRMNRTQIADEIRQDLDRLGFEDQEVIQDDRGVTIRLNNIEFPADSAFLWDSEKEKLQAIAEILNRYPDRDIVITGHTALAGTERGRLHLSQDRAAAVGNFFLELGVRDRDQMILKGVGATEPVADNSTEEGRRRNRRVEITILEN